MLLSTASFTMRFVPVVAIVVAGLGAFGAETPTPTTQGIHVVAPGELAWKRARNSLLSVLDQHSS